MTQNTDERERLARIIGGALVGTEILMNRVLAIQVPDWAVDEAGYDRAIDEREVIGDHVETLFGIAQEAESVVRFIYRAEQRAAART